MDQRPARFLRTVGPDELLEELIDEAKDRTWSFGVEVALVELRSGARAFVTGGHDGIIFEVWEAAGEVVLRCEAPPAPPLEITGIAWHTHPRATGPSDGDREALRVLKQAQSRIYEIGGAAIGTPFGPGKAQPRDEN